MSELVSTRDPASRPICYTDALLAGLAPDGGLYVPVEYPVMTSQELADMKGLNFAERATKVKGLLIGGDINEFRQHDLNRAAFDSSKFPAAVDGNLAPVQEVADNIFVQNLSLGPTVAFKDFGLGSLAQEVNDVLYQRGETLTILGATSGDTGSAAEAAFKDFGRVGLFMLSPAEGMSTFQRAQMGALSGSNVHNLSVNGGFDDCQDMVKAAKQDPEFKDLGAVNSINWGRIVAQVAYYFDGYLQTVGENVGREVDFAIPTGNFGNVLSGHVARAMGLPIRKLIAATNENNVMDHLIKTGDYVKHPSQITTSPSMDISKASNYERLLYELFEGDAEAVTRYMYQFDTTGRVSLTDYGLSHDAIQKLGIDSGASTHNNRILTIARVYKDSGEIIDPHTADGVTVARRKKCEIPTICLGTAAPVKFEKTIAEALNGFVPEREERFKDIDKMSSPENFVPIDSDEELKAYLRQNI